MRAMNTLVPNDREGAERAHRIGILGTGLIGGSLAKAIHCVRAHAQVIVADPDAATRDAALAEGVADAVIDPARTPPREAFADCDLLLLAAPPRVIVRTLPQLAGAEIALIADVASVKTPILDAARKAGLSNFIGGHPMAGSETGGWRAARADLFRLAPFILCEPPECRLSPALREAFRALLRDIGFRLYAMDAASHDRRMALVSHLPHAAAFALAAMAADAKDPLLAELAGGGFRDTTRVAASSSDLWADILRASPALAETLDDYIEELRRLRAALEPGVGPDALTTLLRRASDYRRGVSRPPR